MKSCDQSGDVPANSVANQLMIATIAAANPQSVNQIRCGIARMTRKKEVARLRARSSVTTCRIA
jgi:hypothetical protein